jgi:nickel/cobalt transporter (NicO) family protein
MTRRLVVVILVGALAFLGVLAVPARPASAHVLGNLSVNQYEGLALHPDRVDVTAVVDLAEIPTLQEKSTVDDAYPARSCAELARGFEVRVGSDRLKWTVPNVGFEYRPGTGGLSTSRLTCSLRAPVRLGTAQTVTVVNSYRTDRVGWRELTAVGAGVRLVDCPLSTVSVSDELRSYPSDLLASTLDQRSATFRVEPGTGAAGAVRAAAPGGGDPLSRWSASAERRFQLLAGGRLTPVVGVLAVLLALVLGAGHALLPGHGKTVLAAYLAGRRGRARDAVAVGATVTLSHTGVVLLVGLLLSTSTVLAGDRLLGYLGLASGVLVTVVGVAMLVGARRRRDHDHDHDHTHSHDHGHEHHDHHHGHAHPKRPGGRLGLAGIGLAGGLVPSPSALVVLLGAIGLGRAGFGVLLVVAYGLGMAGTLTAAGLLLLAVQRRTRLPARWAPLAARLRGAGTAATAGLVVLVGLGLTVRALAGAV